LIILFYKFYYNKNNEFTKWLAEPVKVSLYKPLPELMVESLLKPVTPQAGMFSYVEILPLLSQNSWYLVGF